MNPDLVLLVPYAAACAALLAANVTLVVLRLLHRGGVADSLAARLAPAIAMLRLGGADHRQHTA